MYLPTPPPWVEAPPEFLYFMFQNVLGVSVSGLSMSSVVPFKGLRQENQTVLVAEDSVASVIKTF